MSMTAEAEERAAMQRKFYLDISPMAGQHTAVNHGFQTPSHDIQERELKDAVSLWMRIQRNGMAEVVTDTSWWMARMVDPNVRKSEAETAQETAIYQSYAVATVQALIDQGVLKWGKDTLLPEVHLGNSEKMTDEDLAILAGMEETLANMDDDKDSINE